MSHKPQILHSASYWKDFRLQRAESRTRLDQHAARQRAPGEAHVVSGAAFSQPPIITFMPNRPATVYSLAQNDGTLALSYNPNCIQSTPPTANCKVKRLPARREPLPCPGSLQETRRRAARKYQGTSEDEKLLARLTGRVEPAQTHQKLRPVEGDAARPPSQKQKRALTGRVEAGQTRQKIRLAEEDATWSLTQNTSRPPSQKQKRARVGEF
ncbi:hypothetical protein K438DRAFT_1786181 [Mycena galopus ATCC 62051]|nr:hypothetical protein K438DRAFT_1786181 [Mycena galopus ATCC 62051]